MIKQESLNAINPKREIIDGSEKFVYALPCEELRPWISNFTLSFPDEESISDKYTIMPHGSVTLVYYHNESGLQHMLFGATTEPKKVGEIANKCDVIFIIEFQPAGFFPFSGIKQNQLLNTIDSLATINPLIDKTLREFFLKEELAESLFVKVEKLLADNIQEKYPVELTAAIQLITENSGKLTSKSISQRVSYSERQLNRFFNQYLGISLKAFSRIVRVNHSLRLLNQAQKSLMEIFVALGYYDSSHFIKDFKIVCGITPQEYRKNMSDFYSEVAKF
ncbi:AraC-like DNA-binding protein [Enterococcus sp. PF1-24]|uniref:helix-turn-helix domain-containing protein n=1 Tax=unclassified Enterococcus TaxID=2608891 RepID=UPI0024747E50|nr:MULTISPECIES: helix-turn-helix domain-containing protein [unclassified Enterococcus]MDH6363052.1 AraC-like DNA-binding protein [Enterococcus sp. PFB1-1]MDH6400146.1 AraC-like DNA-binding protein [Enterococcus sp. PF1-24]